MGFHETVLRSATKAGAAKPAKASQPSMRPNRARPDLSRLIPYRSSSRTSTRRAEEEDRAMGWAPSAERVDKFTLPP